MWKGYICSESVDQRFAGWYTITGLNKVTRAVRTLKTMGKVDSAQNLVYKLMYKLGPVRGIITKEDNNWEKWTFEQLEGTPKILLQKSIVIQKNQRPIPW